MLGVVIWTDVAENKAIIWCEDHGELAFLGEQPQVGTDTLSFDQGDLIQFDLTEHRNLRLARNAKKVAQHYCSDLGEVIATAQAVQADIIAGSSTQSARLISLDSARAERAGKSVVTAA